MASDLLGDGCSQRAIASEATRWGALLLLLALTSASCSSAPPRPEQAPALAREQCFSEQVRNRLSRCPRARTTEVAPAAPWPTSGQLVKRRTVPIRRPLSFAELSVAVQREEQLKKLSAPRREQLLAGDRAFEAAARDARHWPVARRAFEQSLSSASPVEELLAYRHYRLADVLLNLGEPALAMKRLVKVIEIAARHAEPPGSAVLADQARRGLVLLYAHHRAAAGAYDYFRPLTIDGSKESTLALLAELGQAYLDAGSLENVQGVYEDLMRRDGDGACRYQGRITRAAIVLRSGDLPQIVKGLEAQLAAQQAFAQGAHPEEAKRECTATTIAQLTEMAMVFHIEFVGDEERGTSDPRTGHHAEELYELVLQHFTGDDLATVAMLGIPEPERPTEVRLRRAVAQLHRFFRKWERCFAAYDQIVQLHPGAPGAVDDLRGALQCHHEMRIRERQRAHLGSRTGLAPADLTEQQQRMVAAAEQYLCLGEPASDEIEDFDFYVQVELDRAHVLLKANQWESAALALRDVALRHPGHPGAADAAALYLRCLEALATMGRTSCGAMLDPTGEIAPLLRLHCTGQLAKDNERACAALRELWTQAKEGKKP